MKAIVFGLGNYYRIQKPKLQSLPDVEIVAFADNNTALWGKTADGSPVIPPEGILSETFDKVIIISLYVSEIYHQLTSLGVGREKIISWPHFWSERMKGRMEIFMPEGNPEKQGKKVLIISNDLNYDGASLAAVYAAGALNRNWNAVLAVPAGNERLIRETVGAGITVAVCPALPWPGEKEQNWIKQFDAVIVNTFPMAESALAVRKIRPVLWWMHESRGNYPIVMWQYPDGLEEKSFEKIRLCAVSGIARRNFNSVFPGRLETILPPGIPDRPKKEEKDSRKKKLVFAITGVVIPAKGQDIFLEAAQKIQDKTQAEFWVIGRMEESDYCNRIKETVAGMDSVRLPGELTREEMDDALPKIDVVVCASREETLSIAVIEGMMSEAACITTRETGIADYIEDGKNGFITAYGDSNALAEKMKWIIDNQDRLPDMKKAARKTYEKYFGMDVFGRRLEDMISETERKWKEGEPSPPRVTVILPSLNVAAYIRECIESVINQTLPDIEILCIDAGSTDGTCEIIKEYAAADSRVHLIRSEKRSYGYQINLGMELARGEYLGIVETDDSIEPDMYEVLYRTAEEHGLDYAKAGFYTMVTPYEGERYLLENPLGDTGKLISFRYFAEKKLSPDVYIWNGIYRLSFLREHHIRLNESPGAAFQDCGFRYLADMNLGRGMFLDRLFYHYRRDNASASTYHPRFAEYNLAECRYIREKMKEEGIRDRERKAFMARETVMMALSPYTTYREHGKPTEEILSALDEFREIIMEDREQGLLRQEEMLPAHFIEMRLFTEEPEAYEAYIGIRAEANYNVYGHFVRKMAAEKQLVVFCTGKAAKFALCLLRMNRLENIAAFCDNDREKWGGTFYGYEVLAPEEAVRRYPEAHYLVAVKTDPGAVVRQLEESGIGKGRISVYGLPLNAFGCTNLFMRGL